MQIRNRGNPRPILHREPMVGWASTADRARQEPSAQSLVNDPRPSPHRLSRRRVSEAVPKFEMILNLKTANPAFSTRGRNWRFHSKKRESNQGNRPEKPA